MKLVFPAAIIATCLCLWATAMSQTVLIDVQSSANGGVLSNTNPALGDVYNNFVVGTGTDPVNQTTSGLVDSTGSATTWNFTLGIPGTNGAQVVNQGAGPGFNETATQDGVRTGNSATGVLTLSFSGLDNAFTYDLQVYVDSGLSFTGDIDFAITTGTYGGTNPVEGVDTTVPNLLTFAGITPDAGGNIVLTQQANGSGNQFTRGSAVNAVGLTAVPEPSTAALAIAGLALFAASRRRRR